LKQLISYSQHISHGEYEEAPKELVFDEFEQLRLAMTNMADKVQKSMEQLEYFASTDFLTGLMNRRSFDDTGEREFERAKRAAVQEKTLWLIILDIDHFKRVNDTAGHAVGDLVIQAVATELLSISRKSDIVGRLGGEEYGILLPEATRSGVERVARQVLERVPELVIDGWTDIGGPVTVSVGCACFEGAVSNCRRVALRLQTKWQEPGFV
jgi:diguanylate cyclase (GGDEF)-like protein